MNKSGYRQIIERVDRYLKEHFPTGGSMILGVSGGPDSMCLLYILSRLKVDLTVVHCNYQLRGDASDEDQHVVEEAASMWGYDTISVKLDPMEAEGENFQNWARERRYQVFRDLKEETGAAAIAVAHHQDDQLETIIQKILRGAGLTAWQGMKPWNGELFRPLLETSKAEILRFVSAEHVPYRLDSTNEESTYARNFLRNGWFPVLDDLFPGWRDNILKVPDRAREHEAVVRSLVNSLLLDERSIRRDSLIAMVPEVQKPLILQILKSVDPDMTVSAGALENLEKMETLQTGKRLTINEQWSITRDRDRFILSTDEKETYEESEIQLEKLLIGMEKRSGFRFEVNEWEHSIKPERLQLDAGQVKWPVTLRTWKKGDRMKPLGLNGTQNVSDLLANKKIPSTMKSSVKVLESADGEIVAILFPAGADREETGTISHSVRCSPSTETALLIRHDS